MTIRDLYNSALAVMPSNTAEDNSLEQYMVYWVNLLLRETVDYQNAILRFKNEPELESAPTLGVMGDELPYAQPLSEKAFVWGIAAFMAKDDDDITHEQDYRGRYIQACEESVPMIPGQIRDVYGEG